MLALFRELVREDKFRVSKLTCYLQPVRFGFDAQGYDVSGDLGGGRTSFTIRHRRNAKTTHVESIEQPLLRDRVKTFRTPAMISQPNIMAVHGDQHPLRVSTCPTYNRDFSFGLHSTTTLLSAVKLVAGTPFKRPPSLGWFANTAEEWINLGVTAATVGTPITPGPRPPRTRSHTDPPKRRPASRLEKVLVYSTSILPVKTECWEIQSEKGAGVSEMRV